MAYAERPQGSPSRAEAGARAEGLAAKFLESRGLTIVDRNFRTRRGEIDLIARDGAVLVFVEVRLRRSQSFGGAGCQHHRRQVCATDRGRAGLTLGDSAPNRRCRFDAVLLDSLDPARIEWERDILSG
jgi:putative endonuclease